MRAWGVIVLPGVLRRHVSIFDTGYEPASLARSAFKPSDLPRRRFRGNTDDAGAQQQASVILGLGDLGASSIDRRPARAAHAPSPPLGRILHVAAFGAGRYRSTALARAFAASSSRLRGAAVVTRAASNCRAIVATSSTARSKAI
jgi:hypothetical protein